jgi:hypothetical protein
MFLKTKRKGEAVGAHVLFIISASMAVTESLDLHLSLICDTLKGIEFLIFAESSDGVPKIQSFSCISIALLT